MLNIRKWVIAGGVLGVSALTLFATLIGAAATDPGHVSAAFVLTVGGATLLGLVSACLLVGAGVAYHLEQQGNRYIEGVQKTVDRLAQALPGASVRRIG